MKQPLQHWQSAVRHAPSEDAVLVQVRKYLASLSEDDIGCLPESARPVPLEAPDDLMAYNLQVARDELMGNGDAPAAGILREMVLVLNEAASRIANMSLDVPPRG